MITNILDEGKNVFNTEILALEKTRDALDQTFVNIVKLITKCEGKVIVTGMGKPGHIAAKLAATFASLGTPSFHLHPAEAMHGDLGMVAPNDIVIAISYSGESDEIVKILPNIKMIGAILIGITGNGESTLAHASDYVQVLPKFDEACYLGLAPTSSTTSVLCYGDALAVVASGIYGFRDIDFGKYHPAGSLGKRIILKVKDLMNSGANNAIIKENSDLKDAIVELSRKGLGVVCIVDEDEQLKGIITDGDLRRQLEKGADIYNLNVSEVMNKNPITITENQLAVDALNIMRNNNITCIPVVKDNILVGTLRLQTIISIGIVA